MKTLDPELKLTQAYDDERDRFVLLPTGQGAELFEGEATLDRLSPVPTLAQIKMIARGAVHVSLGYPADIPVFYDPNSRDVETIGNEAQKQYKQREAIQAMTLFYGASMFDQLVTDASENKRKRLSGKLKKPGALSYKEINMVKQTPSGTLQYLIEAQSTMGERSNTLKEAHIRVGSSGTVLTFTPSGLLDSIGFMRLVDRHSDNRDASVWRNFRRVGSDHSTETAEAENLVNKVADIEGGHIDSIRVMFGDIPEVRIGNGGFDGDVYSLYSYIELSYNPHSDKFEPRNGKDVRVSSVQVQTMIRELLETIPVLSEPGL